MIRRKGVSRKVSVISRFFQSGQQLRQQHAVLLAAGELLERRVEELAREHEAVEERLRQSERSLDTLLDTRGRRVRIAARGNQLRCN